MIVLAIDPSINNLGWAILDLSGRRPRCLFASTDHPFGDTERRLTQTAACVYVNLCAPIDGLPVPKEVVVEDQTNLHHAHSARGKSNSAAMLCRDVQHRVSGAANALGLPVTPIAPKTWRARLGLSKATDAELHRAVAALCDFEPGSRPKRLSIHAVEAILIGIAGGRELRRKK